jgi:hypothetical protein
MHHTDYISASARILGERGQEYGPVEPCFERIANMASLLLNRNVSPFEVCIFHIATKLARSVESPTKSDTWIDLINYSAFAGQFSAVRGTGNNAVNIAQMEADLQASAAEIAKKYAPKGRPVITEAPVQDNASEAAA